MDILFTKQFFYIFFKVRDPRIHKYLISLKLRYYRLKFSNIVCNLRLDVLEKFLDFLIWREQFYSPSYTSEHNV